MSPNQLFMGSYLLFNLAAVHGIRLMAVKWLRHKHGPSAEKAPGNCLFPRSGKKMSETYRYTEILLKFLCSLISFRGSDVPGTIIRAQIQGLAAGHYQSEN